MKKLTILLALALSLSMFTACNAEKPKDTSSTTTSSSQSQEAKKVSLEEKDGLLKALDLENSPFEQSGLSIKIKTGEDGYAKFVKTDLKGGETKEYYIFNQKTKTVEQFYYVAAMGTGFYYTFDLTKNEMVKVEDDERNDSTESTKKSGRFDGAAERMKGDVTSLQDYFKNTFGKTIEDTILAKAN